MNLDQSREFRSTLEAKACDYDVALSPEALDRMIAYYEMLNAWNARLHLVAPTSPQEFATRHVLESLLVLKHLPSDAVVADIGSGGGLPILPNLIASSGMKAVLIESSKKKAIFLREALTRTATSERAIVIAARFEDIEAPEVGFITCRALERFESMIPQLINWAPERAVFLLFGGEGLAESLASAGLKFTANLIPNSRQRFLYVARRTVIPV